MLGSNDSSFGETEFDIMFSYCWANKETVIRVKTALQTKGYRIWFDEQRVHEVGNIYKGMYNGLSTSKIVCAFLSVHYENSANCERELCFASDRKQPIVPIRLDCGPFTWSHIITAGTLYVDFSDEEADWSRKIDELVENIESTLSRSHNKPHRLPTPVESIAPPQSVIANAALATAEPGMSNTELKALLDPADLVKMANDVDEVYRKRLPGTREWLLADVKRWATDIESASSSVFWLVASAGAGKSVGAASVINELKSASTLGGFFICKADRADRNDPARLIRTVAYQLAIKFPVVAKHIEEVEKEEPGFTKNANVARAFEALIGDSLTKLAATHNGPVVIVLDALDECGKPNSPDRTDFLSSLSETTLPPNCKLFITSRPESDIRTELDNFSPYEIELNESRNRTDLLLFATDRLTRKFRRSTTEEIHQHATALVEASYGLFIWLYLACEDLRKAADGKKALTRLLGGDTAKAGTADRAMDKIYLRTLSNAFDGTDDEDGWCENFRIVVGAIVTVRVPLNIASLADLLDMDEDTVAETLGKVAALLYIADDQVRVIHKSFADFLADRERCSDERFQVDRTGTEQRIAEGCLRALNDRLRPNMCDIGLGELNSEVSDLPQRVEENILQHVQYATRFWVDHVVSGVYTVDLLRRIDELFQKRLVDWLEVVSVLELVSWTTLQLRKLQYWVKPLYSKMNPRTIDLIHDTYWFIQEFSVPIFRSAPHIRRSALPFCPYQTSLYKTYQHELNVQVIRGAEPTWSACIRTIEGHKKQVSSVAVTGNGERFVSGSGDGTVNVWDLGSGNLVRSFHGGLGKHVAVTEDGEVVVTASWDVNCAMILDVKTGRILHTLSHAALDGHTGGMKAVAVTPKGERVVTGSMDHTAKLWDGRTGELLRTFMGHRGSVEAVAITSNGLTVVTGSADRTAMVWNAATGNWTVRLKDHSDGVSSVAITPDGKKVVTGSLDRTLNIWDAKSGKLLHALTDHTDAINTVAITSDGQSVISGSADNTAKIWDGDTGEVVDNLEGHTDDVTSVAITSDGRIVTTGSYDETAKIWDVSMGGSRPQPLEGHTHTVTCVVVAKNDLVITGSYDGTAKVWNAITGEHLYTLAGHTGGIYSLVVTPDGQTTATGSWDGTAKVWEMSSGRLVQSLEGHGGLINSVALTADGEMVLTGSSDGTARLWHTQTGTLLRTLTHDAEISHVTFTRNDLAVVTLEGSTARVWDRYSGQLVQSVEGQPTDLIAASMTQDSLSIRNKQRDCPRVWEETQTADGTIYAIVDAAGTSVSATGSAVAQREEDGWVLNSAGRRVGWLPGHLRGETKYGMYMAIAQTTDGIVMIFNASRRATFVKGWLK
ncbi:hypothetical protein HDV00_008636 [Rhizophlyctis rosea]|nr:hypothetical protein HDV00_008636 [Rhizophlyctis rosea]